MAPLHAIASARTNESTSALLLQHLRNRRVSVVCYRGFALPMHTKRRAPSRKLLRHTLPFSRDAFSHIAGRANRFLAPDQQKRTFTTLYLCMQYRNAYTADIQLALSEFQIKALSLHAV